MERGRGVCPIDLQAVTLSSHWKLSRHVGVYFAEKVAQCAQNADIKDLTSKYVEISKKADVIVLADSNS